MIPSYLTSAMRAPHAVDGAAALSLLAAAYWLRRVFPAAWKRCTACLETISGRVAVCVLLAGLISVGWRLAILPWNPPPSPQVHDEFSHLLVADTLLAGRLANPPHPLWRHLDTIYVLQQPTYASTYPLAQGFFLAAGQYLFGHPWAGVVLSTALMNGAICWMLFGCLSRKWAALGGLITALAPGVAPDWLECYYGGAVSTLGGALLFGALFRCLRFPSLAMGLVAGVGWSLVWLSRPFEAAVLLPISAALAAWGISRSPRDWKNWLGPAAAALAVLFLAGLLTVGHNRAVTGSWTTLPYRQSQLQNGYPIGLYGQSVQPPPVTANDRDQAMYAWQLSVRQDHLERFGRYWGIILFWAWASFVTPWYSVPLLLALLLWRDRLVAVCIGIVAVALCVCAVNPFFFPRYIAPYAPVLVFLIVTGLARLSRWSVRGQATGRLAVAFLVAGACLMGLRLVPLKSMTGFSPSPVAAPLRDQVYNKLLSLGGQHAVLVRYGASSDFHQEFVYNAADVDSSPVVWCRWLGKPADDQVARYYAQRRIWILDVERTAARLSRAGSSESPEAWVFVEPVSQ